MLRFNNALSDRRGRGNGMGGYGMGLRDGSCQGLNRRDQIQNASGPGFFNRFFTGGNSTNRTSNTSDAEDLMLSIKNLQQQINDLKNQSGK